MTRSKIQLSVFRYFIYLIFPNLNDLSLKIIYHAELSLPVLKTIFPETELLSLFACNTSFSHRLVVYCGPAKTV